MKRVFIIGYMGSGKTTVGKRLAEALSLTFIDLDTYIESRFHKSISALFADKGEEEFRKIEHAALREVIHLEDVVVSTGGGAPCFFNNMELMNTYGTTVYIEASPGELAERLLASKTVRPLIVGKTGEELISFIREHLAQRECYYNKAQILYHTDRMITKDEIHLTVRGIEERLNNHWGNV